MSFLNPINPYDVEDPTLKDLTDNQRFLLALIQGAVYLVCTLVAVIICGMCFTSCTTTKTVTVERVRTDTVRITQTQRDSIFLHDSIHVKEYQRGDTVWMQVDRWHTQYRDRLVTDTLYQSRTDSIPVPYPVEKLVPAELTTWQRLRLWLGNIALVAILALVIWSTRKWWLKLVRLW